MAGFKKEYTLFQNNKQHFISQDFRYEANGERCWQYLLKTSALNFGLGLFVFLWRLWRFFWGKHFPAVVSTVLFIFVFLLGWGVNLLLFLGYYFHVRGKMLLMSKGNDIFYYGPKHHLKAHRKSDIMRVVWRQEAAGNHSPTSFFAYVKLEMKDASEIYLPNLLLNDRALIQKLEGIPQIIIYKMAFLFKPDYIAEG